MNEEEEKIYRKGVSHGFAVAKGMKEHTYEIIYKRIRDWSYDLSQLNGIPGSKFEDIQFYFPKTTEEKSSKEEDKDTNPFSAFDE